jgi:EpsI family protein
MNSAGRYSWIRFSLLALLLAATLGLLRAREREEILPSHSSLADFPATLGDWRGSDLEMSAGVRETLGPGEFLFRDYVNMRQRQVANLFVAFFPSQRQGDTIHSPKNCLPGSGWIPTQSSRSWITLQDGRSIEVNKYLVEKGTDRAVVLYWYQSHGRVTPSEYKAKYHLVADSIAMNRSDGAMIRITTFPASGESIPNTEARAVQFAQLAVPLLENYIPR